MSNHPLSNSNHQLPSISDLYMSRCIVVQCTLLHGLSHLFQVSNFTGRAIDRQAAMLHMVPHPSPDAPFRSVEHLLTPLHDFLL